MKKSANKPLLYTIIVIIALFLIFFISFKIASKQEYEVVEYNKFQFIKVDEFWHTEWQEPYKDEKVYTLIFRSNPYEVENIPIVGTLDESFNRPEIYITFDPTQDNFSTLSLAGGQLSLNMFRALQVKPIAACTKNESTECAERPIVDCGDEDVSVILITDQGEPGIALREECIILQGEGMGLLQAVDRLLYQWYRIMK